MSVDLIVAAILAFAPVALVGALCALNAMRVGHTPPGTWIPFLLIAWGWGAVIFAALDFLANESPLFWPRVLLFGVMALAGGNALLFVANRLECRCAGCPGRKGMQDRRRPPARLIEEVK